MTRIRRDRIAAMNAHYQRYSLAYCLDALARIGYTSLELWLGGPHVWVDSVTYQDSRQLAKAIRDRGLRVVSTTTPSMAYQYQYSPMEASFLDQCLGYFSGGIRLTAELGAGIMTVNPGWCYATQPWQEGQKRTAELLFRLARVAEENGVTLALESLTPAESAVGDTLAKVKSILERVNHPRLKAMCDTVAVWESGETLDQWFDALGEKIVHTHFIDHKQGLTTHHVWGDGAVALEEQLACLERRGYRGYLAQELSPGRYAENPADADARNFRRLERCFCD